MTRLWKKKWHLTKNNSQSTYPFPSKNKNGSSRPEVTRSINFGRVQNSLIVIVSQQKTCRVLSRFVDSHVSIWRFFCRSISFGKKKYHPGLFPCAIALKQLLAARMSTPLQLLVLGQSSAPAAEMHFAPAAFAIFPSYWEEKKWILDLYQKASYNF